MSEVETALRRLEQAVAALEETMAGIDRARDHGLGELMAERDRLAAENRALREAAERDAELRTEAAEAVKAALSDLRALMPEEERHG